MIYFDEKYNGHKIYMDGEYPAVFLNRKNTHVHRLEWIKHNGEIPGGYVIHHKDENKLNWDIDNLELMSREDHIKFHRKELIDAMGSRSGEKARNRKLTQADVDFIRNNYKKRDPIFGGRALAKKFNVTEACISRIVHGLTWGGGGEC